MKTKTITALEQALADVGGLKPRHPDEITAMEMLESIGGAASLSKIQHGLLQLARAGKYTRRRIGNEWVYRKSSQCGAHSDHDA